jgi:hypothetical protein
MLEGQIKPEDPSVTVHYAHAADALASPLRTHRGGSFCAQDDWLRWGRYRRSWWSAMVVSPDSRPSRLAVQRGSGHSSVSRAGWAATAPKPLRRISSHRSIAPASSGSPRPVMKRASSEARNRAAFATSRGSIQGVGSTFHRR